MTESYEDMGVDGRIILNRILKKYGARGSVMVKALCYKPEGRGSETRRGECIFFQF
jgi:hypothetical protein